MVPMFLERLAFCLPPQRLMPRINQSPAGGRKSSKPNSLRNLGLHGEIGGTGFEVIGDESGEWGKDRRLSHPVVGDQRSNSFARTTSHVLGTMEGFRQEPLLEPEISAPQYATPVFGVLSR